MKTGARLALGVGIGYVLGRSHKMRLALMVAAAGAAGRLGESPTDLLRRGLSASPELSKITDTVRGELLGAAKAAAVAAASNRIEALGDRLRSGGTSARDEEPEPESAPDEEPEEEYDEDESPEDEAEDLEEEEEDEEEPEQPAGRGRRTRAKDEGPEEEEEKPQRPAARRRRTPTSDSRARRASRDDESEDEERAPVRRRAARSTAGATRSPIRRARR